MITIEGLQDFVLAVVSLKAAIDVQHPHHDVILIILINLFLFEENTSTVSVMLGLSCLDSCCKNKFGGGWGGRRKKHGPFFVASI